MSEAIIVGIISGAVSLITAVLVFITNNKKLRAEQEKMFAEQLKAQDAKIDEFKKEITKTLLDHKDLYIREINDVHSSITAIKAENQQFQATFTLQIDELSRRVEKHNSVVERTFALEKEVAVLDNREKVSEKRLLDIERLNSNDCK